MLIIAALGELFILIVSLAIIFIKWHIMEQRYKNKEKGGRIMKKNTNTIQANL